MNKIKAFIVSSSLFAPVLAFAQQNPNDNYITTLITKFRQILESIVPVLIVVAVLFFMWEVAMFIKAKKDGEGNKMGDAKKAIGWSLLALFVLFSFMGIVRILQGITGTTGGNAIDNRDTVQFNF